MTPIVQTIFGDGSSGGERGNCFAACIASILDVPLESVPNFCNWDNWREKVSDWLQPLGYAYIDVMLPGDGRDELVRYWGYHVISGDAPRGLRHSVVGLRGEIAWDPHPSFAGLLGTADDWEFGLIIKTFV
jgi:hypothetical protein